MGQKHSLEDDLITFKLTSKQMARSAKKCEKNQGTQTEKLKKAIKDGNMEGAKIYAQNVIREKNQALNFLRLGSRIDAVASRLETAIRMQDVNKAMAQTVKGMSNAMKSMQVEQIANTMEEFERQFENMDVRSGNKRSYLTTLVANYNFIFSLLIGYMESTMEATTSMSTPPEQVDQLIQVSSLHPFFHYFSLIFHTRWLLLKLD
jgi:charged multivesicular body protein 1